MKSLVRFGHRMLLTGAAIAGTTMGLNLPAWALPEEVILQKLETVPMYMLITDDGQPIFASVEGENGEESVGVTGVFVSPSDAENLVLARREEAKTLLDAEQAKADSNPSTISVLTEQYELWQEANILPIGLDRIYQFAQSDDAENLTFKFFPTVEQLEAASQVTEAESFPGVPLFFLSVQSTDENGNPITTFPTLEAGGKIPIFFEVDPILEQIQSFENQETLSINVMALEVFISKLANNNLPQDEQNFLKEMTLIPAEESALLIQQIIESTNGENGNAPQ